MITIKLAIAAIIFIITGGQIVFEFFQRHGRVNPQHNGIKMAAVCFSLLSLVYLSRDIIDDITIENNKAPEWIKSFVDQFEFNTKSSTVNIASFKPIDSYSPSSDMAKLVEERFVKQLNTKFSIQQKDFTEQEWTELKHNENTLKKLANDYHSDKLIVGLYEGDDEAIKLTIYGYLGENEIIKDKIEINATFMDVKALLNHSNQLSSSQQSLSKMIDSKIAALISTFKN